jgi:hypothetical protein
MEQSMAINAYNSKAANLADRKAAFRQAHENAIATHTHMNEITVQTAMRMESGLTEYEAIEEWRSQNLQEVLRKLAQWMTQTAEAINEGAPVYSAFSKQLPSDDAITEVMVFDRVQRTSADDSYALIPIDTRVTKFLDKSQMFLEEQKKGLALYQAVTDVVGTGYGLSLAAGEVVALEAEEGDERRVVNINGSRGLVPASALAPFT